MYFQDINSKPPPGKNQKPTPGPDSIINNNDRVYLGKTIPGYFYGLNFDANYAGFDISIFLQGIGDVQKRNGFRAGGESLGTFANQFASVLNRWTATNPSTTMPRNVRNNVTDPGRSSDRFVEDAGYLRLKTVEVGYRLQSSVLGKVGFIQSLRVFGRGVNLLTATKWKGWDPELDANNDQLGLRGIPPTRQLLIGVNASF
jgi:hypothetical protein